MPEAKTVILRWPTPPDCAVFQSAVTIHKSVLGSYFMAVGFNGGYLGIQDTGLRTSLIFSVWDGPGNDKNSVPKAEQARLIRRSARTTVQRFGGEGCGLQCFGEFDFQSVVGNLIHFKVVARRIDKTWTQFSAFFGPGLSGWEFLCSYRARMFGKRLNGFYSFIEDFRRTEESAAQPRSATYRAAYSPDGKTLTPILRATYGCPMVSQGDGINLVTGGPLFFL